MTAKGAERHQTRRAQNDFAAAVMCCNGKIVKGVAEKKQDGTPAATKKRECYAR